ncbi:flagellar export protein FliJ [Pelagibius sp. Alg239-R121]|uniref:flagellar export protein FliJ n=1 Tax=Pelagibius sp. Alg239-R121 TaxID=2993448 RepID=UPI0024A69418|nr:flagellar export protein FliJ [Pelagibius sp. Alg239-R121]
MTALHSLVRVHQWELDEKRQKLADMERLLEKLQNDLAMIDQAYESEKVIAGTTPEASAAFPNYAAAVKQRRQRVEESIQALQGSIEETREEVRSAFQELKKYQTAESNQQRREQAKQVKREQQALDEVGLNLYRRRKTARRA